MDDIDITQIEGLHIEPVIIGDSDEYEEYFYNLSRRVCDTLNNLFKDESGEIQEGFMWLRTFYSRPAFHHICFDAKGNVFSCLIGILQDNEIRVSHQDWLNFQRETKKYNLRTCVIPVIVSDTGELLRVYPLLDAETLEMVSGAKSHIDEPISDWELYCLGVCEVLAFLLNNGITEWNYCDILGTKPSVFFKDADGQRSYVLVRSIPAGLDEEPYTISKEWVEGQAKEGIKGYFVNALWGNAFGNSGLFVEKEVFRKNLLSPKIELEPIEDVEKNHKNIKFVEEGFYNIDL